MFYIGKSTFRDLRQLKQALNKAEKRLPVLQLKAMNDIADIARKHFQNQFGTEGAAFSTKWAQLAKSTRADRKRRGYKPARPILVRRGWLRASVVSKTSAKHKAVISETQITLSSILKTKNGKYNLLELHQKGTKKMPARKIFREGTPPFISAAGWKEVEARFTGMFIELRREMENFA